MGTRRRGTELKRMSTVRQFLLTLAVAAVSTAATAQGYDLVIENGRVIDPETGLDDIRNVGIDDDQVVEISEFPMLGDIVVDATDRVVAPGFIDLHAHGNNIGDYRMMAVQGITTAL